MLSRWILIAALAVTGSQRADAQVEVGVGIGLAVGAAAGAAVGVKAYLDSRTTASSLAPSPWSPVLKARGRTQVPEEIKILPDSLSVSVEQATDGAQIGFSFDLDYPALWTMAQPKPDNALARPTRVRLLWMGEGNPLPSIKIVPPNGEVYEVQVDPRFEARKPLGLTSQSCESSGLTLETLRSQGKPAVVILECSGEATDPIVRLQILSSHKADSTPELVPGGQGQVQPRLEFEARATPGDTTRFQIWDREGRRLRSWFRRIEAGGLALLQPEDGGFIFSVGLAWNPQVRLGERVWLGGRLGGALLGGKLGLADTEMQRFIAVHYLLEGGYRLGRLEASLRGGLETWIWSARGGTFPTVQAKFERRIYWNLFRWLDGIHLIYGPVFTQRMGVMHQIQLGAGFRI